MIRTTARDLSTTPHLNRFSTGRALSNSYFHYYLSADVRSVLYMSTLVATRYNPLIQSQYQQLLKRGKLKKVALTACMRKFLTILNAMLRDQQPFRG
jgi:transposase